MRADRNVPFPDDAWWALKIVLGVVPFLAGLDKFFNFLADWEKYLNPRLAQLLPMTPVSFMHIVGIIEMVVGLAILTKWTRIGAYVAGLWLLGIVLNLVSQGAYLDVAARDLVMAVGAFSLARLTEALATAEGRDPSLFGAPAQQPAHRPAHRPA